MSCKPLYSDIRDVGKTISSTKKLFIWKFSLDNKDYTVELYNSMLSGKKKIVQNGQIIYENNSYQGAFQFPFTIGRNSLSIVQHGDRYELRINNQSFEHLMNQRSTQSHFKSDFNDPQEAQPARAEPRRQARAAAPTGDEDSQMRAAIEASLKTKVEDEKKRQKGGHQQVKARVRDEEDDVDFGANFEKFATYAKPGSDDINDFDFNAAMGSKEEAKGGDFDFNFNNGGEKKKSPEKSDVPDLMDLLGGGGGQSQPAQQQPVNTNTNPADLMDMLAAAGSASNVPTNQQASSLPGQDPFGADPMNSQQQQQQPAEKPKFQPNPVFQSNIMPGSQQQMMYQSQFGNPMSAQGVQMQQNLGMGMQQQYFQTGQQPMGGMPMQQQYGMQPNAMMGGMQQMPQQQPMMGMQQPMQNQLQGQSPFDAFGSGPSQQSMPQQQQEQKQESTPFDMFA